MTDATHGPASPALAGMVPTAAHLTVPVVEQAPMARDTWRLRLRSPEIAAQIVPGQFFMVRAAGREDPLLGRPFALLDTYEDEAGPAGVDFGYVVVGKLTSLMPAWQRGESVEIWGPLGNGFPPPGAWKHLMLVAGGIGQTPFLAVAREALGQKRYGSPARPAGRPGRVTLCYGVRSAEYFAGLSDFALDGLDVQLATDDGTRGRRGFVTDLVTDAIDQGEGPDAVYCCGPEPMMHAVQQICLRHEIPCWLSLESPMACGFGACFSCVVRVRMDDGTWDYRRSCVEGPVFPAGRLVLS
ncbi:MAG TPA: dihydroorotate dehydrogenase electron transfer subunit [Planctomycetaceae bacterium]|nr:dihydroorotate dehydrogenase electron transfer subunit [Planctomycetaceae bacterium]